jgi:hypothetical protein
MAPAIRQVAVNPRQIVSLRASGASWKVITWKLGIGVGTAFHALQGRSKNLPETGALNA